MIKKIKVEGRELAFTANALTPILYQREFNSNYFGDIAKLEKRIIVDDDLEIIDGDGILIFYQIAYINFKQAQDKDVKIPDFDTWLSEMPQLFISDVAPVIKELLTINSKEHSTPKKDKGQ